MAGVKKVVVRMVFLIREVERLAEKYYNVKLCLPGSPRHKKAGLDKDRALLLAWQKRKGGET
jgi:hypothetical protein